LVFPIFDKIKKSSNYEFNSNSLFTQTYFKKNNSLDLNLLFWDPRRKIESWGGGNLAFIPTRLIDWRSLINYPESF